MAAVPLAALVTAADCSGEEPVFEILDRDGKALVADGPGEPALAEHGRRLDINEVRRGSSPAASSSVRAR